MVNKTVSQDISSVGKSSIVYIIGDGITRGTSFLLIPLYTRFLTPAEYGNWGVLLSLISLLNILFSFQLGSALTVNYFHLLESERKKQISTIWILILVSSFCMSALFLIIGRNWVGIVFQGISYSNLVLTVGISFFTTFAVVPQIVMRLRQNALRLVSLNVFVYLLGIVAGVVLLVQYELGKTGLLLGLFFANLLSVIPYIIILRNDLSATFSKTLAQKSFIIALPILPHMLSHWVLNLMDRIILQAYLPLSSVGVYQLGYQLGAAFQIIIIAINNAWTPFFLESFKQPGERQEIKKVSSWLIFIQVWIALFLVLFLPFVVGKIFPKEYYASVDVIPWVVLGFVFVAFYHNWVNLLFYYKKTNLIPVATGISALLNFSLNIILVPRYGYLAAAINTVIGYAILAGITGFLAFKVSGFSFEYYRWIKVGLAGLGIYLSVITINLHSLYLSVSVRLLMFISFPVFLYFISFWRRSELEAIYLWLRRRIF
jgi:O-antigen/teichoic acid export membrane protein